MMGRLRVLGGVLLGLVGMDSVGTVSGGGVLGSVGASGLMSGQDGARPRG